MFCEKLEYDEILFNSPTDLPNLQVFSAIVGSIAGNMMNVTFLRTLRLLRNAWAPGPGARAAGPGAWGPGPRARGPWVVFGWGPGPGPDWKHSAEGGSPWPVNPAGLL